MFALISAAAGNAEKMSAIPGYRSRGKGMGKHTGKKWGTTSHRNVDQRTGRQKENGEREVARRLRQIDTGILRLV